MISTSHCCCSLSYAKLSHVLVDHMRWTTYICSLWQNCVKYHSMLLTASSRSIEWLVHVGELMWAKRARKNQEKDGQLLRKANLENSGKIRWHRIYKLGGTEFPRISKGWIGNVCKYLKAHYSWFKIKGDQANIVCELLLISFHIFLFAHELWPKCGACYPSTLIESKVHFSRFKYLVHLFRGSSLHILCLLVLTSLARIHVCSSSVRCLNILSILFTWMILMARVLVVSKPHDKEVTNPYL
jgi:hypothetical protein